MYCVEKELENGAVVSITLCGEEKYYIVCASCDKKTPIDVDDFQSYIEQYGLYGTNWYCEDCHNAHKASGDTGKIFQASKERPQHLKIVKG